MEISETGIKRTVCQNEKYDVGKYRKSLRR